MEIYLSLFLKRPSATIITLLEAITIVFQFMSHQVVWVFFSENYTSIFVVQQNVFGFCLFIFDKLETVFRSKNREKLVAPHVRMPREQ